MTPPSARTLLDADVVVARGRDTWPFLQSLVSQDLDPLADGSGARSLLLSPEGRLVADFRVLRVGPEEAWLDAAPGVGPALAAGLGRFRIRVHVEIEAQPGWGVLAVRGPRAPDVAAEALGADLPAPPHAHVAWGDARLVRADWPGAPGADVVGPHGTLAAASARLLAAGVDEVDDATFEAWRIAAGVPRQGVDVDDRTIPQEAGLETDAVSFTKGCFVGQELVCRIDSRGARAPRHLERVRLHGEAVPPAGAAVTRDGNEVGVVTSAARHPELGVVALAMLRRAVTIPAEVDVRWADHAAAGTVEPLRADVRP
jgi:folate-binding protein YgfZ